MKSETSPSSPNLAQTSPGRASGEPSSNLAPPSSLPEEDGAVWGEVPHVEGRGKNSEPRPGEEPPTSGQLIAWLIEAIGRCDAAHAVVIAERKSAGRFTAGTGVYRDAKKIRDSARSRVLWMARRLRALKADA